MLRLYRKPALGSTLTQEILRDARKRLNIDLKELATEYCFYVETAAPLSQEETSILRWLLAQTFEPDNLSDESFLSGFPTVLEAGPRLHFETAWSSVAVSICRACGLQSVTRLERSVRYGLSEELTEEQANLFLAPLYDRMTQTRYREPLRTFDVGVEPSPVRPIPVLTAGKDALRQFNRELGCGWDEQDIDFIFRLYHELGYDPTDVALFMLAVMNSEHSRHWFFKSRKLRINGVRIPTSLLEIVKTPWKIRPGNSRIAFCDDSSAIRGGWVRMLQPRAPDRPSPFEIVTRVCNPTLTAETHNHPTLHHPREGAATGTGGRIRDNHVVGRGGYTIAGGLGICTANLHIPDYVLPWEEDGWSSTKNVASPCKIMTEGPIGAYDYGNCYGEPTIYGFTRTCGISLPEGYRSWAKPILYTVGAGQVDEAHSTKGKPEKGMLVVQIGGPAYRIGIGGGSASSMIHGENIEELDFASVQRGNPEMENRLNRVIRACIELGEANPIVSARDLGAGGDCNAIPEIVSPAGARINLRAIPLGDRTLSALEIWCNESQERDALLVWPEGYETVRMICEREDAPCALLGEITGDGRLILYDSLDDSHPVEVPLDRILGDLPDKQFEYERITPERLPLLVPSELNVRGALELVLRLPSVGSKRYLVSRVDRSVTGLIAQQQCVGPNQLPISDFAAIAQSYFGLQGVALSLGEQPMKGLISPGAAARLAVAEALLNMSGAKITDITDIKCSANWMLAAKLPGEGPWLVDAACALRDICIALGIAIDGGKDSLSMAANMIGPDGRTHVAKAPPELVIAMYAPMPDITCKVTPDLKKTGNALLYIDLGLGKRRLGGSALAQVLKQVGDESPDIEDPELLKRTFAAVQELVGERLVLSVHDVSDGGLIGALLEMAFAGNVGLEIALPKVQDPIPVLFHEEPGLILEVEDEDTAAARLRRWQIPVERIGSVGEKGGKVLVKCDGAAVLDEPMADLRALWEATSAALDSLRTNPACVEQERRVSAAVMTSPPYRLSYEPRCTPMPLLVSREKPKVAVVRERGSNGDREMAAAFYLAGFEVWDVTMDDLVRGRISLDQFRGLAFPGGFSFMDVPEAGKGWAAVIRFNEAVRQQFERFYNRPDTFSLGVCNGCQLMALLGWVPGTSLSDIQQPRFIRNVSGQFESRWVTVKILPSPAILLAGMEGSILGVWVAHGEGYFHVPEPNVLSEILRRNLAPLRFVDEKGEPTTVYPFNPNGSPHGITALCSPDGRHLAMMPHPERSFLLWQWPWKPDSWKLEASPWLYLFQNAYRWCTGKK